MSGLFPAAIYSVKSLPLFGLNLFMKVSLIIAFYKKIDYLELILMALKKQSFKDFEVIIADDDNSEQSNAFINSQIGSAPFPMFHVNQLVDDGFRKNEVLNKAITKSRGEIIVFIDGDCIPHKHFIKEYALRMRENIAFFGRRVMLSEKVTGKLLKTKDLSTLNFFSLLFTDSKNVKYAFYLPPAPNNKKSIGIWGCNWGVYKKHLLEVNGYDEDYIRAGVGEDVDIEWRLQKNGVEVHSIKQQAIVYHLYHKPGYSDEYFKSNFEMLEQKKKAGLVFCKNGIQKG
jgi:cellulose synthase/poly-beta-1,6-N-acetylglucosamine synthase-like glycosyltransferase